MCRRSIGQSILREHGVETGYRVKAHPSDGLGCAKQRRIRSSPMRFYLSTALAIVFAFVPAMVHASSICDSAPFSFACSQLGGNGGAGGAGGAGGNGYGGNASASGLGQAASSSSANPVATSYGSPSSSTSSSFSAPYQAQVTVSSNEQAQRQSQGQTQSLTNVNTFTPTNEFNPTFAPEILICPQYAQQTPAPQQPNHILVSSSPSTYPVLPSWALAIVGQQVPVVSCS